MDHARWRQLNHILEHPARTRDNELISPWPEIAFEGRTGEDKVPPDRTSNERAWGQLRDVYAAARRIAAEAEGFAAEIAGDRRYSEEGKADALDRYRRETVTPKIRGLRETVFADAAQTTAQRMQEARVASMGIPESSYEIALDVANLAALREMHRGKKKPNLVELSKMSQETRRAIALADPHVSGVSTNTHEIIRKDYLREVGGEGLLASEEQLAAVQAVDQALDMAEVVADRSAAFTPLTPAGEAAAKARAEREEARAN